MRMIGLLCVGIAATALTACSTVRSLEVPLAAHKCTTDDNCVITVFVTRDCAVSVDRPDVEMKGRHRPIRWELDEAAVDLRFRFDPDKGIVLKAPDPDDQFSEQGPQGGGLRYHWRDKNTNYRVYDYQVNIVQRGSGRTCNLDPRIWNN